MEQHTADIDVLKEQLRKIPSWVASNLDTNIKEFNEALTLVQGSAGAVNASIPELTDIVSAAKKKQLRRHRRSARTTGSSRSTGTIVGCRITGRSFF